MPWKNLSYSKKGALIGFLIYLLLILLFKLGGITGCQIPMNEEGEILVGAMCLTSFQEIILSVIQLLSIPIMMLGGTPNMSSRGPIGVGLFYFGTLIWFTVLGLFIGWIVGKIKKKKQNI